MTPAEALQTPGYLVSVKCHRRGLTGGIVGGLLIAALEFAALRDSVSPSTARPVDLAAEALGAVVAGGASGGLRDRNPGTSLADASAIRAGLCDRDNGGFRRRGDRS
jgi:hypothetical protein